MDSKTPIGLKLITVMYVIAVIASIYISFFGLEEEKIIGHVSTPISIIILIGLFNKHSFARIGVLIFSWLAVALSSLMLAFISWSVFVKGLGGADTTQVVISLLSEVVSIAINTVIIMYLNKSNIRHIFNDHS